MKRALATERSNSSQSEEEGKEGRGYGNDKETKCQRMEKEMRT